MFLQIIGSREKCFYFYLFFTLLYVRIFTVFSLIERVLSEEKMILD
jgi:hypothetical protein